MIAFGAGVLVGVTITVGAAYAVAIAASRYGSG